MDNWIKRRVIEIYGPNDYGMNIRFKEALAKNGLNWTDSTISKRLNHGLPPSTLGSPEMVSILAQTLDSTVSELLEAHHYGNVNFGFVMPTEGYDLIEIIRRCVKEDRVDDLKKIVMVANTILD